MVYNFISDYFLTKYGEIMESKTVETEILMKSSAALQKQVEEDLKANAEDKDIEGLIDENSKRDDQRPSNRNN